MSSAKFLLVVIVTTLWLSVCDFHFEAYGDASGDVISSPNACVNSPCQQVSPPPLSGDPSYGAPPPPPPQPPPPAGYSIYDAPPPPHEAGQSKCPPSAAGVRCCTPPAPPYNTYGYGPPNPYAPPNPYTYVPYGGGHASALMLQPILVPVMMLSSSSLIFLL